MEKENSEFDFEKFEWKKDFETGISLVDIQHRELFKRIDELTLAIYDGQGWNEVNKLIKFLESYVHEHFSYEEDLMSKNKCPYLHEHKGKHAAFTVYLETLVQEVEKRGIDVYLAIKVEKEMRKWWEEHIRKEDMLYVPYIEIT